MLIVYNLYHDTDHCTVFRACVAGVTYFLFPGRCQVTNKLESWNSGLLLVAKMLDFITLRHLTATLHSDLTVTGSGHKTT